MWGAIIAVILIVVAVVASIYWLRRRNAQQAEPSTISASADGTWWQVRNGGGTTRSMGTRPAGAIYEVQCPAGTKAQAIGDEGGPVFCSDGTELELVPDATSTLLYGLDKDCPAGWRKDPLRHGDGAVSYVCHQDVECVSHSNCDPGQICDGGRCIPIPDF